MRVLVCIDLSPLTEAIVEEAAKIARATGASLSLLHVVKVPQLPDVDGLEPPEDMAYRVEQVQAIATRLRNAGARRSRPTRSSRAVRSTTSWSARPRARAPI